MKMHRFMNGLARAMALLGGVVVTALILITCLSVLGRAVNTLLHSGTAEALLGGTAKILLDTGVGPILGDYELVEAGVAFAIFAFLPLCQITGGHASVDIFTSRFPVRLNRVITFVGELLFALVLVLIAWRLYAGMQSKMLYGETTFLLQFPLWWAYCASFIAGCLAALVSIYVAVMRLGEVWVNRDLIAVQGVAEQ
jgi:TRAP-type C4-dicarboxylate transport system permease small subunit